MVLIFTFSNEIWFNKTLTLLICKGVIIHLFICTLSILYDLWIWICSKNHVYFIYNVSHTLYSYRKSIKLRNRNLLSKAQQIPLGKKVRWSFYISYLMKKKYQLNLSKFSKSSTILVRSIRTLYVLDENDAQANIYTKCKIYQILKYPHLLQFYENIF